jgi:hypothetical protein
MEPSRQLLAPSRPHRLRVPHAAGSDFARIVGEVPLRAAQDALDVVRQAGIAAVQDLAEQAGEQTGDLCCYLAKGVPDLTA